MQCFQKDPNLRVSARKLLKHPWIVNARRSDSVVPKKSTEYEEAVRSVQEWNEALRSPEKGDLRRTFKSDRHSPAPTRGDISSPRISQMRDPLPTSTSKFGAERFWFHEFAEDDNWDDDFATAISPSALRLPHLRPHDNFGGMLSSEKLKAFASLDGTMLRNDDGFYYDNSQKSIQPSESDPLETIRPYPLPRSSAGTPHRQISPHQSDRPSVSPLQRVPILNPNPTPLRRQPRSASLYQENPVEDFSDLIVEDEVALDQKLGAFQVSVCHGYLSRVPIG